LLLLLAWSSMLTLPALALLRMDLRRNSLPNTAEVAMVRSTHEAHSCVADSPHRAGLRPGFR
jgi:hypothetical protein